MCIMYDGFYKCVSAKGTKLALQEVNQESSLLPVVKNEEYFVRTCVSLIVYVLPIRCITDYYYIPIAST